MSKEEGGGEEGGDRKQEDVTEQPPGITLDDDDPNSYSKYKFEDHYVLQSKLAEGSFGQVYTAKHLSTNVEYAAKLIQRANLSQRDTDNVYREIAILKNCRDVENIVRLVDFYCSSPEKFYVVQVYAEGGDVFERLSSRQTYNEKMARDLATNLLLVMKVLHARKIVHRDLKPENLLLKSMLDDSEIMVADFGFARHVPDDGLKTRCGTPAFVAPEVLVPNCRYNEKVDMWATGALLYMLIGGYPPFQAPSHRSLFRKISGADFCFHDKYWKCVSVSAKQLIASLLTVDPDTRCSAEKAISESNWLQLEPIKLENSDLSASLDEMKKFKARTALKGAIHAVLWSVRNPFTKPDFKGLAEQLHQWDESDEMAATPNNSQDELLLSTEVKPTLKFKDIYELQEKIHESPASAIWRCTHKHKQKVYAVKVVDRKESSDIASAESSSGSKSVAETICHEVAVLRSLKHEYILQIVDFFDEEDYYYLVMEDMEGGDVFDRILQKKSYTEKDARDLARFLLEAVSYLHDKGICHRDLKPQNLLLKSKDDDAEIKVAGFDFACRVHTPQSLTKRCGTPTYVAPEILKNIPYDTQADMWSYGVILYVLLCGYPPFANENQSLLFEKIRLGEYDSTFRDAAWAGVSNEAKDVIRNLLVVDPLRRWTAKQALQSDWLRRSDDERIDKNDLTPNVEMMKRRKITNRFRSSVKAVLLVNSLSQRGGLSAVEKLIAHPEGMDHPDKSIREIPRQ